MSIAPVAVDHKPETKIMKLTIRIILGAAVCSALTLPAPAQDASTIAADGQESAVVFEAKAPPTEALSELAKASNIIGMTVRNDQNEKLGKVADLAVDVESGRIVEVILSSGGLAGFNRVFTPVPPQRFRLEARRKGLRVDVSTAGYADAPKFFPANWNQCTESNRVTEVYAYFGVHPYFVADHGEYRTTSVDGIFASTLPRNMDGTINTTGARSVTIQHNEEMADALEEPKDPVATQYPEGTWTTNHLTYRNGSTADESTVVYVQKLAALMGKPVHDLRDQKLGQVKNFVLDLPTGRIIAVIISSDGSNGTGMELSAVSPTKLRYSAEFHTLQLDSSAALLASYPHFKANEWPEIPLR
jgi:sporulation protein YlmC with PRC-barrel domain